MPRLNHGTLLENLVVLEVARTLGALAETLEFASAFAMPPLTQCWHKTPQERGNNPRFNSDRVAGLLGGTIQPGRASSYSALLLDCLRNSPDLPVVPYADSSAAALPQGGPNGALLVALLRRQAGQKTRIWSNDIVDSSARYRGAQHDASSECPRTREYAESLRPAARGTVPSDDFCGLEFPSSAGTLAAWRQSCEVRLGFLDPDSYVATGAAQPGQVDRAGHARWLHALSGRTSTTAGMMFFANRSALARPALMRAFHDDAVTDFPHSVVFRHGNYMVGVKLRGARGNSLGAVVRGVEKAWASWARIVGRNPSGLSSYLDGGNPAAVRGT